MNILLRISNLGMGLIVFVGRISPEESKWADTTIELTTNLLIERFVDLFIWFSILKDDSLVQNTVGLFFRGFFIIRFFQLGFFLQND